jgi:hypothetical protein
MDIQIPSNADVVEHDQASAPGKERERDPILGGDLINLSNGAGVDSEQREFISSKVEVLLDILLDVDEPL